MDIPGAAEVIEGWAKRQPMAQVSAGIGTMQPTLNPIAAANPMLTQGMMYQQMPQMGIGMQAPLMMPSMLVPAAGGLGAMAIQPNIAGLAGLQGGLQGGMINLQSALNNQNFLNPGGVINPIAAHETIRMATQGR